MQRQLSRTHAAPTFNGASTVPAAVLADLLGIHTTTADWARAVGGDWTHYAAEIARGRHVALQ